MTNINLLPPEIYEKRRAERLFFYLIIGFIVLIALFFFVYLGTYFLVTQKQSKVDEVEFEARKLKTKTQSPKYTEAEQVKTEFEQRRNVITQAMAGEVSWYTLLNEVSMVIPSDVWLVSFSGDATGIKAKGYTFKHPAVAKWLERMTEIKEITGIWLTYSQKATLENQPVVEFEVTAKFPGAAATPTPAQGSQSGQSSQTQSGSQTPSTTGSEKQ